MVVTIQAESKGNEQPDADFLEFLAEIEEATGDGFSAWLEIDTDADSFLNTADGSLNTADGSFRNADGSPETKE